MSSLPTELDFANNPAATPARMNAAMAYIVARFRAIEAVTPDFSAAVDQLKAVGLERLNEVLTPIFANSTAIDEALTALQAEWLDTDIVGTMEAEVLAALRDGAPPEFNTLAAMAIAVMAYRSKYLGAKASPPSLDDNGNAVVIGATYFDTALQKMQVNTASGWKDAGSVVGSVMNRQSYTATGGETSVPVSGGYDPGNIVVTVNGLTLSPSDVNVTSGSSIGILTGALSAGDKVSWTKFGAIQLSNTYLRGDVDAKLAANVPEGHISGLTLSTAGGSPTFSVARGQCADSAGTTMITQAGSVSRTVSAWTAGGPGALDTGSISVSTWYHVFKIYNPTTTANDILLSMSQSSPTLPAGYTAFRRIGSMKTDGSGNWLPFVQIGDKFSWTTPAPFNSVTATTVNADLTPVTLAVPPGLVVEAIVQIDALNAGSNFYAGVFSAEQSGFLLAANTSSISAVGAPTIQTSGLVRVNTDNLGRVYYAATGGTTVSVNTFGWVDQRGRNG